MPVWQGESDGITRTARRTAATARALPFLDDHAGRVAADYSDLGRYRRRACGDQHRAGHAEGAEVSAIPRLALVVSDPQALSLYYQVRGRAVDVTAAGGAGSIEALSHKDTGAPYAWYGGSYQVRLVVAIKAQPSAACTNGWSTPWRVGRPRHRERHRPPTILAGQPTPEGSPRPQRCRLGEVLIPEEVPLPLVTLRARDRQTRL